MWNSSWLLLMLRGPYIEAATAGVADDTDFIGGFFAASQWFEPGVKAGQWFEAGSQAAQWFEPGLIKGQWT